MIRPDPHTAIAERLEAATEGDWPRSAPELQENELLLREAAQALRASADEVEQRDRQLGVIADLLWSWGVVLTDEKSLASFAGDLLREMHEREKTALARATQAEADLASARKALEPFAIAYDRHSVDGPCLTGTDWQFMRNSVDIQDFRRAAEALRASTIGEEGEGSACTDLSALSSSAPRAQFSDGGGE